ncbi:AAA domain-containing protein [Rugosimonospora africana]|uniref:AAA domain-containing protein n=1 Tax=Rugosimonospora africana TaxID=556532 RepID=UPI001EF1AEFC|nr:AAA domain-containing protein [Rugosimonospora africana]
MDGVVEADSPGALHGRAVSLVEYLLAVRSLLDRPVRTVPSADAYWQADLPSDPACRSGPTEPGGPWLRVGRPAAPPDPEIPTGLVAHLSWDLSYMDEPTLHKSILDKSSLDESSLDKPGLNKSSLDESSLAGRDLGEAARARQDELLRWLEQTWRPWSRAAASAEAVRRLHDRLYDLRYRLDMNTASTELVWGHAVLRTVVGGHRIAYPLLATPVAIEYDPESAEVRVVPQGPPRLQPDALADLDSRRVADLIDLGGPVGQVDVDPWDETDLATFIDRAARRLALSTKDITGTGVLFARPRQRMVRRFLEDMRTRLSHQDGQVGALASVLAHEPSRLRLPGDDPDAWRRVGERLLMPMPSNEAQESIARRLAQHRGVAVQGPPGTGKTHTIRNLICHLVAHGKRVLVLAQKEDPLRVLRDGLPEQIQPLCLAILGRSADQLVQLQIAARELSDRAATLDKDAEARWADKLEAEIERAEDELAAAQERLREAAERESATFELTGGTGASPAEGTGTASEVGEWLRTSAASLALIPDAVPPEEPPPLTVAEFAALADLARRIPPADRAAACRPLPVDGQLPTGEQLAARRNAYGNARKAADALLDRGVRPDGVRQLGQQRLDELARALREAAGELARREGSWTDRLGHLLRDPAWQAVWDAHVDGCQQALAELSSRTAFLAGRRIEVPEEHAAAPRQLLRALTDARDRLAEGRKIGRFTHADLHRLMAACRVDGEELRAVADVELVIASVERAQLRSQLATRWAEWSARLDFPVPPGAEPEIWAGQLLATAIGALDWERSRWPALAETLSAVLAPAQPHVDARTLAELAGTVEACGNVLLADRLLAEREAMAGWIATLEAGGTPGANAGPDPASPDPDLTHPGSDPAHPGPLAALAAAWREDDLAGWDAALAEIRRLWTVRPDALRFAELAARLAPVAPGWTGLIEAGTAVPDSGEHAHRAWRWRQAQTWFDDVVGQVDTAALGRRVERCRDQIRSLVGELVVTAAWLGVARSLDDRKKAALADWTAALRKIGKGTGKSAAHWQAMAQQAMTEAVTAVPVWVMSIDRALEQFRGGEPLFDVVIVDEASQADIFALPVLSLARRAVVVGDDQQIGPQLVGVPSDKVGALIADHLRAVPSSAHFDTESSLYDHAVRRSPERILLTEHFRCVPAIIAFSSDTYYDRKIQPLRADSPAGIDIPVTAVFVPGGLREQRDDFGEVNVAEAEALVSRVALIVDDPRYDGRSIGVVSLLSTSGQAAYLQHRLREAIGAEELERRRLRVGDPYTFQGDERDVVLVSMVVAQGPEGSAIGAFTRREYHRRINVAASRARDQLWLFHSVRPEELPADDARALLLAYCQQPRLAERPPEDPEAACTNDFERAVLRRLRQRGLSPVPQFRIGAFRIDFVLPAPDGRRLAIECDGDRYHGAEAFAVDLRRQAILERVGNARFVRIRSSVFHRDPDVALAPVFQRATDLGLLP